MKNNYTLAGFPAATKHSSKGLDSCEWI